MEKIIVIDTETVTGTYGLLIEDAQMEVEIAARLGLFDCTAIC
jgi:hypothetical protein